MKMLQKLTMAVLIFGVSAGAVRAMDDITDNMNLLSTTTIEEDEKKLVADEQQLDAAYKQLDAVEQQLVADEQQLDAQLKPITSLIAKQHADMAAVSNTTDKQQIYKLLVAQQTVLMSPQVAQLLIDRTKINARFAQLLADRTKTNARQKDFFRHQDQLKKRKQKRELSSHSHEIPLNAKQYDKFLKAKQRIQPQSTSTSSSSADSNPTKMSDD